MSSFFGGEEGLVGLLFSYASVIVLILSMSHTVVIDWDPSANQLSSSTFNCKISKNGI